MIDWLEMWFESRRDSKWAGSGTIIRKAHREALQGDALGFVGTQPTYGSSTVPERWVLVVDDSSGSEIYVEVQRDVWDSL